MRQRRGVLGCTNLPSITHNCEARTEAHHVPRQPTNSTDTRYVATQDAKTVKALPCDNVDGVSKQPKPTRREKFKLPLMSSSSTGGTATRGGQSSTKRKLSPREAQLAEHEKAKQVLAPTIDSHEIASKSYKNEHWYTSPIGFGSRKSVLMAAFKSRDPGGSGFITCKQLIDGLQAPNFGLDEQQARAFLVAFDDQLQLEDSKVHYGSFVKHLRLPEEQSNQPGQDPTIFYQEAYVNQVRAHAAQLIEKVASVEMASTSDISTGNSRGSGSIVLSPLDATLTQSNDVDRLSFEFDKVRKQRREEAKSRILLAHINRIEAFSQHQQTVIEQHETMRLAAKALHRHAHFEQAFEEENHRLRIAQRHSKGMFNSPIAKMHHNVSKDSMFYVDPV